MTHPTSNAPCEVLLKLQAELDALSRAVRKASDILSMTAESPDTLRRRRNSMERWHEIYAIAFERLHAHAREHKCNAHDASASS